MTARMPLLLTPGPLTTAASVHQAMLRDWGSREPDFVELTARLRRQLMEVAGSPPGYVAVPLQGSGTFAVEATLSTLLRPHERLLVLSNGAYAERLATIAQRMGQPCTVLRHAETTELDARRLDAALQADRSITHVAVVHCETSSGMLNRLEGLSLIVQAHRRRLIVDAMSSFGALALDFQACSVAAVVASCNKCLESVPGIGFALIASEVLDDCRDVSRSLSLDLHAQWRQFESNGQWRFTPPVQVVAAAAEALSLHAAEGGARARCARYESRAARLVGALQSLQLLPLLPQRLRAPTIVAFRIPSSLTARFGVVVEQLRAASIAVYAGKLTQTETFRVGCMGAFADSEMERFFACMREALQAVAWLPAEAAVCGGS